MEAYISGGDLMVAKDEHGHIIPLGQPAVWCHLLGYTNILDAIDAIMKVGYEQTDGDELVGESLWTEPMVLQAHLETVREEAAEQAQREGKQNDPRSPLLRSAMAVHQEAGRISGEQAPTACVKSAQGKARMALRTPNPSSPFRVLRDSPLVCDVRSDCGEDEGCGSYLTREDREVLVDVLSGCKVECDDNCEASHFEERLGWMQWRKEHYAHQLTGRKSNPLESVESRVERGDPRVSVAERLGINRGAKVMGVAVDEARARIKELEGEGDINE